MILCAQSNPLWCIKDTWIQSAVVFIFQRSSKGESPVNWYTNAPVGHNATGDMKMLNNFCCSAAIVVSKSAGLSKRYTNHSLRSTKVHLIDSNQFAGRHITSITGHKSETSLKTYTGYTAPNIKRKMSDTITDSLRPEKTVKYRVGQWQQEEHMENEGSTKRQRRYGTVCHLSLEMVINLSVLKKIWKRTSFVKLLMCDSVYILSFVELTCFYHFIV